VEGGSEWREGGGGVGGGGGTDKKRHAYRSKSPSGGAATSRRGYRISHYPARYQKQLRSDIINILLRNPDVMSVKSCVHVIRKT